VCEATGCIKILGAFVGDPAACAEKLLAKAKKHQCFFSRLSRLGGPIGVGVLQKCGVPRATFFVRTHSPEVSALFAALFEQNLAGTLFEMARAVPDASVRDLAAVPSDEGGLGITNFPLVAPLCFAASVAEAFGETNVDSQAVATALLYRTLVAGLAPEQARIAAEASVKGTAAWMTAPARWDEEVFAAALRYRLGAVGRHDPPHLQCAPCGLIEPPAAFDRHAVGCVKRRGPNTTKTHNAVRDVSADIAEEAGLFVTKEPRDFKSFVCFGCSARLPVEEGPAHLQRCSPGSGFRKSGPDVRISWDEPAAKMSDGTLAHDVVYDWTVVYASAASHKDASLTTLFAAKRREKEGMYQGMVEETGSAFVVLGVSSLGVFAPETAAFVRSLARALGRPRAEIESRIRCALARGIGRTLRAARARRNQQ
jgi:hypothetical protein